MTREEELKQAMLKAIKDIGFPAFKETSFFGRNVK